MDGAMTFNLPMPPSVNNMYDLQRPAHPIARVQGVEGGCSPEKLGSQYARMGSPSVHRPVALTIRLDELPRRHQ
ncbi:hypothetical protein AB5I41_31630 [Sphingomonas sp. MMS24-JH45]